MSKTVNVRCDHCGTRFDKPLKEIVRQRKRGVDRNYCGASCSAHGTGFSQRGVGRPENLIPGSLPDHLTPFREHLRRAKIHSKERGQICRLTLQDLFDVWQTQQGKCAYSGIALCNPTTNSKHPNPIFRASLDRIDSSRGYEIGNVQFVTVLLNYAKSNFSGDVIREFLDIVRGS